MTSANAAQIILGATPSGGDAPFVARCTGAWTLNQIAELERHLQKLSWPARRDVVIDGSALTSLDISGAWVLHRLVHELERSGCTVRLEGLRPEFRSLQQLIASREIGLEVAVAKTPGVLARLGGH